MTGALAQKNADTMLSVIDMWSMLMHKIGKGTLEEQTRGAFGDLMLKEWARENLLEDKSVMDESLMRVFVCVCALGDLMLKEWAIDWQQYY